MTTDRKYENEIKHKKQSAQLTISSADDVCLRVGLPENPVTPWRNIYSHL